MMIRFLTCSFWIAMNSYANELLNWSSFWKVFTSDFIQKPFHYLWYKDDEMNKINLICNLQQMNTTKSLHSNPIYKSNEVKIYWINKTDWASHIFWMHWSTLVNNNKNATHVRIVSHGGNNNSGNYKIPLVHSVRRGVSLFNKCELTLVAANWPMWWPESATLHVKTGIRLTKNDNQRQIISQSQPAVMNMLSHRRLRTSTFASQHTKMNDNKKIQSSGDVCYMSMRTWVVWVRMTEVRKWMLEIPL